MLKRVIYVANTRSKISSKSMPQNTAELTPEQEARALLRLGQMLADSGSEGPAEAVYRRALTIAETGMGKQSALAGSVLLELWDLYERTGREEEASQIWKRLTDLLAQSYGQLCPEMN